LIRCGYAKVIAPERRTDVRQRVQHAKAQGQLEALKQATGSSLAGSQARQHQRVMHHRDQIGPAFHLLRRPHARRRPTE
jgi:hypothetical protein